MTINSFTIQALKQRLITIKAEATHYDALASFYAQHRRAIESYMQELNDVEARLVSNIKGHEVDISQLTKSQLIKKVAKNYHPLINVAWQERLLNVANEVEKLDVCVTKESL